MVTKREREVACLLPLLSAEVADEEELAEKLIEALDAFRKADLLWYPIVQIVTERGPGRPYVLPGESTYLRAVNAGVAGLRARQKAEAEGHKYRYMVGVKLPSAGINDVIEMNIPMKEDEVGKQIAAYLKAWKPGIWASEDLQLPSCVCGLGPKHGPSVLCHRHQEGLF